MSITFDKSKFHDVIWNDYNLSYDDFLKILSEEKVDGWFSQNWALVRMIENLNYYDFIHTVPLDLVASKWKDIKGKIYDKTKVKGLEYVLRKKALSVTR